jgi:16S rRNA (guanine966-N2)-methyltransferase
VAGVAGGRRLAVPARGTRPTSDRVREALFSSVEAALDLDGARVLDLYAGSGALGLEALSRGAAAAAFVENDAGALRVLRRNLAELGLPGATVHAGKVATVLASPADAAYDLVVADPPYQLSDADLAVVLDALVAGGFTEPGSLVVVERATRSGDPRWPAQLVADRVRRYGDTALHWARHRTAGGDQVEIASQP